MTSRTSPADLRASLVASYGRFRGAEVVGPVRIDVTYQHDRVTTVITEFQPGTPARRVGTDSSRHVWTAALQRKDAHVWKDAAARPSSAESGVSTGSSRPSGRDEDGAGGEKIRVEVGDEVRDQDGDSGEESSEDDVALNSYFETARPNRIAELVAASTGSREAEALNLELEAYLAVVSTSDVAAEWEAAAVVFTASVESFLKRREEDRVAAAARDGPPTLRAIEAFGSFRAAADRYVTVIQSQTMSELASLEAESTVFYAATERFGGFYQAIWAAARKRLWPCPAAVVARISGAKKLARDERASFEAAVAVERKRKAGPLKKRSTVMEEVEEGNAVEAIVSPGSEPVNSGSETETVEAPVKMEVTSDEEPTRLAEEPARLAEGPFGSAAPAEMNVALSGETSRPAEEPARVAEESLATELFQLMDEGEMDVAAAAAASVLAAMKVTPVSATGDVTKRTVVSSSTAGTGACKDAGPEPSAVAGPRTASSASGRSWNPGNLWACTACCTLSEPWRTKCMRCRNPRVPGNLDCLWKCPGCQCTNDRRFRGPDGLEGNCYKCQLPYQQAMEIRAALRATWEKQYRQRRRRR